MDTRPSMCCSLLIAFPCLLSRFFLASTLTGVERVPSCQLYRRARWSGLVMASDQTSSNSKDHTRPDLINLDHWSYNPWR